MKKLIVLTLLLLFLAPPAYPWNDAKFNFRSTSAFDSPDGAGETYVISNPEVAGGNAELYSVPRDGITFGWVTAGGAAPATRDRSTTPDVKFAGVHYNDTDNTEDFRVDLDCAGTWDVRIASGDYSTGAFTTNKFEVFDNVTSKFSISTAPSGADKFVDATGTEYSSANWVASNTAAQHTFSSTTFILRIGNGLATVTGVIAHLELHKVSCGGSTLFKGTIGGGLGGKKMVIGD